MIFFISSCKSVALRGPASHTVISKEDKEDKGWSGVLDTMANFSESKVRHIKILYGTDRKEIKMEESSVKYEAAPANIDEEYKVGYTIVSIPNDRVPGEIRRPSIWKLEFTEDSTKHMLNKNIIKLSSESFDEMLKSIDREAEAFLFVHGYNNSFEDAALRTAQITEDIGMPIVPIMFSWPSNGALLRYGSDGDNVRLAVPAFKHFLKRISSMGGFKKLHIVAHSMGNRLIASAFKELKDDSVNLRVDQVIMAAPDLYADEFRRDLAEPIVNRAKRVTVYAAKNDWALKSSKLFHTNLRLGQISKPPFPINRVDIIDASEVKTDFLGHGGFAQSQSIMNDINKLINTSAAPNLRGIKYMKIRNLDYYYFARWG
ncbi:MAG: alpha/beta hydrolase, partial [Sphingobacteriales bacterium]